MQAQLIVGPAQDESQTDHVIQSILEEDGFQVALVGVDEAVQSRQRDVLSRLLSDQAALTVANSGIRWENVTRLVPPGLLPNSIVITSSTSLQTGWDQKPVIIVERGQNLAETLRQAARSLVGNKPRLPVRSGTYVDAEYGMRLYESSADMHVDAWQVFTNYVHPGYRFSTRVRPDGSSAQFTITKVLDAMLVLKVDFSEQVVAVTRDELLEHFEYWKKEQAGIDPGHILVNDYVIGILDWLDDSRLLT